MSALTDAMATIAKIPHKPCVPEYDLDELDEVLAGAFARVSKKAADRERSNDEQLSGAEELCNKKKRWRLHDTVYVEQGSASKFAKKRRKNFDQLVEELEADAYKPDVLVMWEVSRSTRRVDEMHVLLALLRWRGKYVHVIDDRRTCSPWSINDWKFLIDAAADAEKEVMQTSHRTQRAATSDAVSGRFTGGRRPFGFDSNGTTHRDGTTPEGGINEKQLIIDAVRRILAGDSVRSICAEWNADGIRTAGTANNPDGNEWKPSTLSKVLKAPRLAGLRIHNGVVQENPAEWAPIISRAERSRLIAVLASRSATGDRGRSARMLTGLLKCELCGADLLSNSNAQRRVYTCRKGAPYSGCGHLNITAEHVERVVGLLITEHLALDDARKAAEPGPDDAPDLAELDDLHTYRREADEDYRKLKKITRAEYDRRIADLDAQAKEINKRIAARVRQSVPVDFVDDGRQWSDLTEKEKRKKALALIESIRVGPVINYGSHVFDDQRIAAPGRITWR